MNLLDAAEELGWVPPWHSNLSGERETGSDS